MKVATVGLGLRSSHVLSIFKKAMPEFEFVGYFDPNPTHLEEMGVEIPRYNDIEEMLKKTKPDMYFVGSPNQFHLEHIKYGLEAEVPLIFTEKPVVISISETMELAKLLQKHNSSRILVGLVLRYSQHMIDLNKAINQGILGEITSIEASEHIGPFHGAFFMRDWRRKTSISGGFMLEKCCHDMDIYNMITGSRPAKVASFGGRKSFLPENAPASTEENEIYHIKKSVWNSVNDPFKSDGDIVDYQTAIISYENGANLAFHTNINVPDEQRRFCIIGTKGMAEGDFVRGFLKVTQRNGTVFSEHDYNSGEQSTKGSHYGADNMMVDEIVDYLNGDIDSLPVSILDALVSGLAALALDRSMQEGKIVDMAEIWSEFDQYQF